MVEDLVFCGSLLSEERHYIKVQCNAARQDLGRKGGGHWVGIDSMCTHSITPDPKLVGVRRTSLSFRIQGWSEGDVLVQEHGINPWLGLLIYCASATSTLLSYYELLIHFNVKWSNDGRKAIFTHKVKKDLRLIGELDSTENGRLVLCDLSSVYQLIEDPVVVKETLTDIRMTAHEYSCVLEAWRFHQIHHQSVRRMKIGVSVGNLRDYPFTEAAIGLMETVFGSCPCCKVAGLVKRSTRSRQAKPRARPAEEDKLPVLTTQEQRLLVTTSLMETLLVDIMFWFQEPYLVCRGMRYGKPTTVALSGKSADAVGRALELVILDYKRARIRVSSLIDIDDYYEKDEYLSRWDVESIRSDNEPSIVRMGLMLLQKYNIDAVQVPAGEHVHGVERTIRTLKVHLDACYSSLVYSLPAKARPYLVGHVTFWESLYPNGEKMWCPFAAHNAMRLLYSDVTRCKFGDSVIAYRPVEHLGNGVPHGEEGISLGSNPRAPGSIFFYSTETHQVKCRARYTLYPERDLLSVFEPNKFHVRPIPPRPNVKMSGTSRIIDPPVVHPVRGVPVDDDSEDDVYSTDDETVAQPSNGSTVPPNTPMMNRLPVTAPPSTHTEVLASEPDVLDSGVEPLQLAEAFEQVDDFDRQASLVPEPTGATEPRDPERDLIPVRRSNRARKSNSHYDQMSWVKYVDATRGASDHLSGRTAFLKEEAFDALNDGEHIVDICSVSWEKAAELVGAERAEKAHTDECDNMLQHEVFEPTTKSLNEVGVYFNSRDLFDQKLNGKDKSRLVVTKPAGNWRGKTVDFGIDESAPTIDIKIVLLMLSLCLQFDLELEVWDVKGAFLFAKMVKDGIYVLLRPKVAARMVAQAKLRGKDWGKFLKSDGSLLVEVKKAWYGTTAAPALWNREIDHTLREVCGYMAHPLCCCLYTRWINGEPNFILLHVDDMGVMFKKGASERDRVLTILETRYGKLAKQTGDLVTYIGIDVRRDRHANCFNLSQKTLLKKMASERNIQGKERVPCDNSFMSEDEDSGLARVDEFRSLVMSLRYVASLTRPEILFHTTFLATRQSSPTGKRMGDAVRLMKYLLHSVDEEMIIRPCGPRPQIRVHADASSMIYEDLKGHTGIAVFVGKGGASLFSKSKKQSVNTDSSTDAEIVGMTTASLIGDFFYCFLEHLGIQTGGVLYLQDNTSAMHLMEHGCRDHVEKRKFVVNRINCIKQYLDNSDNNAMMQHFGTKFIAADILSKPLLGILRDKGRDKLMGKLDDMATMTPEEEEAVAAEKARQLRDDARRAAASNKGKHI